MVLEVRKSHIFLLFILLHVLFWIFAIAFEVDPKVEGASLSLVSGDWDDLWLHIIYNDEPEFFLGLLGVGYGLQPWSKFLVMVQDVTGLSLYFGIIFYSLLNTLLFLVLEKILNVFNQKYSTVAALFIMLAPTSLVALLTMYKDIYSYMAFALILLVIVRNLSNKPLNLTKSLFLYFSSVFLIWVSRGDSYTHIITFLFFISLPILFLLLLNKSYSFKNIFPLLFIFLIHIAVFYSDAFKLNIFSGFGHTPTNQQELMYRDGAPRLTKAEYLRFIREELLISHKELLESDDVEISRLKELIYMNDSPTFTKREYLEIQELLISQEKLLKSADIETIKLIELIETNESPTLKEPDILKIQELLISQEEFLKSADIETIKLIELIETNESPTLKEPDILKIQELLISQDEFLKSADIETIKLKELIETNESPTLKEPSILKIQELLISQEEFLKSADVEISRLKELIETNESPTLKEPDILKIQELLISQEEFLKSADIETIKLIELIDVKKRDEFSWYKGNPDWVGYKLKELFVFSTNKLEKLHEHFFNVIRSRKTGNIMGAPNASLNYDSSSTLTNSNIALVISHIPISIFPPYISQISDINASNIKKIVLLGETVINYILVLFLIYYAIRQKIPQISFILVLFSCMLLICLLDSNFGVYIRHAFIFLELFFGMGLLVLLETTKLNLNFGIRKGLL